MKTPRRRYAIPLARRLALYRIKALALLTASGFVLGFAVLAVATVSESVHEAVETAVRADAAGRPYAIQAGSAAAVRAVSSVQGFAAVRDASGFVDYSSSRTPVVVRTTREKGLELGSLLQGRRAQVSTEGTLSRAAADSLGAAVGDKVDVEVKGEPGRSIRLVGITVDSNDRSDATAVVFDPDLLDRKVTLWLSKSDPYAIAALRELMDARSITYRSTDSSVGAALDHLPVNASSLRLLPLGLAFLLFVVFLMVAISLHPTAKRDALALMSAGMSSRRAWQVIARVALGGAFAGVSLGFMAAQLTLSLSRDPVSSVFGQFWLQVSFPTMTALGVLSGLVVLTLLSHKMSGVVSMGRRLNVMTMGVFSLSPKRAMVLLLIGSLFLVGSLIGAQTQNPASFVAALGPIGALMMVFGLPVTASSLSSRRRPPATRALLAKFNAGLHTVLIVAGVVAVLSGSYSAMKTHNARAFAQVSGSPQPRGSMLVTEVPAAAAEVIATKYVGAGGTKIAQFDLPDERRSSLRATGIKLVSCMERAQTMNPDQVAATCFPQRTYSPVGIVVLSRDQQETGTQADPGILEEGQVGLLRFPSKAIAASRIGITNASALETLGGNMPSLVVSADGPVARRFDLRPSGTRLVAMLGFNSLPAKQQAQIRSTVSQLAPAAQVADADADAYASERAVANVVALAGAGLVTLIVLGGGLAMLVGQRRTLRTLADLSATSKQRQALAGQWIAAPLVVAVSSAVLAWASAASVQTSLSGSSGQLWLAPALAGAACCAVLFMAFIKVPERQGE